MAWNYFSKDHRCMDPSGPCAYPHAMAKCYATGSKKKRSNFRVGKIIFRYGFIVTFKKYETCRIHVNIY